MNDLKVDLNLMITEGDPNVRALEINGDAPWELWPGALAFIHTTEEPQPHENIAVKIEGKNCIRSSAETGGKRLGVVKSLWARVPGMF